MFWLRRREVPCRGWRGMHVCFCNEDVRYLVGGRGMHVCFCYEDVRYLVGGGEACMYVLAMKT